jgi:hypothetical protein
MEKDGIGGRRKNRINLGSLLSRSGFWLLLGCVYLSFIALRFSERVWIRGHSLFDWTRTYVWTSSNHILAFARRLLTGPSTALLTG